MEGKGKARQGGSLEKEEGRLKGIKREYEIKLKIGRVGKGVKIVATLYSPA